MAAGLGSEEEEEVEHGVATLVRTTLELPVRVTTGEEDWVGWGLWADWLGAVEVSDRTYDRFVWMVLRGPDRCGQFPVIAVDGCRGTCG